MRNLIIPLLIIVFAPILGCSPNYKTKEGKVYRIVDAVGYYNEIHLEEADHTTFEDLGNGYAKDCCTVFWLDKPIESADPSTIKVFDQNYASDSLYVYFKGRMISGADPHSFNNISKHENVSRDKNHVFFGDKITGVLNPTEFNVIYDGATALWGRDGQYYYYFGNFTGSLVLESDYQSTQILSENYAVDKNSAYYKNEKIVEVDIDTFEVLNNWFARDKHNVFFESQQILGADANSFEATNGWFSTDKNCEYKKSQIITCAHVIVP